MARLTKRDKAALAWAVYQVSTLPSTGHYYGLASLKCEGKPYAHDPLMALEAAEEALHKMRAHWDDKR